MYEKIEDVLEHDGEILELPAGGSMRPMLRFRRDQIVIARLDGDPKNNDVVLFKSDGGRYVLHRIVKVGERDYVTRGDHCYVAEYGIRREQIIGRLKGFYRNEKYIDCESSKGYRMYVTVWRLTYPIRAVFHAVYTGFVKALVRLRNALLGRGKP